ncbi:MAG: hypothetical protein HUJ68_11805 [Clostridia bacterium]|nr:hypothetical protein [Clostridia bacterium]
MFIYNVHLNGSKVFKAIFSIMLITLFFITIFVIYKIIGGASASYDTCLPSNVCKLTASNYTNVLKAVHDNIDDYIGTNINFTGYIYRISDLQDNQFILARDMIISSNNQYVIVGFLCENKDAKDFQDGTWVEITGQIYKGNYHGDMPIVSVTSIIQTEVPNDEYVYPPDENYIPTSALL